MKAVTRDLNGWEHELAGRQSMTFEELAKYPLIMRERGSKARQKPEAMDSPRT